MTHRPYLRFLAGLWLAAVCLGPVRAAALLGEPPSRSFAMLILPAGTSDQVKVWVDALRQSNRMRLTVGLSPNQCPPASRDSLSLRILERSGNCELALRLNGDPPIPLMYGLDLAKIFLAKDAPLPSGKIAWPEDVTGQIVKAKMNFKLLFGEAPKGFISGGGSLNQPTVEFLKKQKFLWSVASFPAADWPSENVLSIEAEGEEPLTIFNANSASGRLHELRRSRAPAAASGLLDELENAPAGSIPVVVFDEARALMPLSDFLVALGKELARREGWKMSLISEARAAAGPFASAALQVWPYSWTWVKGGPGLAAWIGHPDKNAAWELLIQARNEIERYKNSGSAVLEKLDPVMEQFYKAESAQFFEAFGADPDQDPEATQEEKELEFNRTLAEIYPMLNLPVPPGLKSALSSAESHARDSEPTSRGDAAPAASSDGNLFSMDNQELPADAENLAASLRRFAVKLERAPSEEWMRFQFAVRNETRAPLLVHIYIDINNRVGAGWTALPGLNAGLSPADGWEYVVKNRWTPAGGWSSELFRAGSQTAAYRAAPSVKIKGDSSGQKTWLELKIPKRLIGESPSRWGYLVCLLETEKGPLIDFMAAQDRRAVLGKLKQAQQSSSESGRVLLPMVRAELD